jgi:hypothetical protein
MEPTQTQSRKNYLFVFPDIMCDYTAGMAFAIARNYEHAIRMLCARFKEACAVREANWAYFAEVDERREEYRRQHPGCDYEAYEKSIGKTGDQILDAAPHHPCHVGTWGFDKTVVDFEKELRNAKHLQLDPNDAKSFSAFFVGGGS